MLKTKGMIRNYERTKRKKILKDKELYFTHLYVRL